MPRVNGRNPAIGLSKSTNKEKYSIIIIIIIINNNNNNNNNKWWRT